MNKLKLKISEFENLRMETRISLSLAIGQTDYEQAMYYITLGNYQVEFVNLLEKNGLMIGEAVLLYFLLS